MLVCLFYFIGGFDFKINGYERDRFSISRIESRRIEYFNVD